MSQSRKEKRHTDRIILTIYIKDYSKKLVDSYNKITTQPKKNKRDSNCLPQNKHKVVKKKKHDNFSWQIASDPYNELTRHVSSQVTGQNHRRLIYL